MMQSKLLRVQWICTLFVFLLGCSLPAQAQVSEAARPLVPKYLNQMLGPLQNDHVAYLVITAGSASTDVMLIASPNVSPPLLVDALRTTIAATPLRSQPIEWSSPTNRIPWVAAHAALRQGHFGAWQAQNTVPFGAFYDGLHRAGYRENPNLHLPVGVDCTGLPPPYADFNGDRWYYLGKKAHPSATYQVTAALTPGDLLPLLLPLLLIPALGLAGQAAAVRWARLRDQPRQNRKRFDLICNTPTGVALVSWMIGTMFSLGSLSQLPVINDIWFGRAGESDLFSAWFVLILMVSTAVLLNGKRLSMRLYGPEGSVPAAAMSPGERSIRERETLWAGAVPLVMCGAVLVLVMGGLTWIPSPAAPFAARLLPVVLLAPLVIYFRRQRKAFTTFVPDAALTDQVRPLVAAPGLTPVEVVVEESARAKTYPFVEGGRDGRVVVSQKLIETATPEQMRFLLASQSVLGRTRDWATAISLLTIAVVFGGLLGARFLVSSAGFAGTITVLLLLIVGMFVSVFATSRMSERRVLDADRDAVRLTGNREAALEALTLLRQNAMPTPSGKTRQSTLQLSKRIAALERQGESRGN